MPERADITLTVGGQAIGTLRSASLNIDLELVGVAPEDVYGWDEHLAGARGWSASGSLLVPMRGVDDALVALKEAMVTRTSIACIAAIGSSTETGTAVVSSLNMQASIGGVLEGSMSLTGTGTLTAS